jgi:hypothetical protein
MHYTVLVLSVRTHVSALPVPSQTEKRWRAVVTKCDEIAKQATIFGKVVIIETRRKSESTELEAAKVEVLL